MILSITNTLIFHHENQFDTKTIEVAMIQSKINYCDFILNCYVRLHFNIFKKKSPGSNKLIGY